jgi:hypothetical protein
MTPWDRSSARHDAYIYRGQRSTENRRQNIHAPSGIRTYDLSIQAVDTHALDFSACVISTVKVMLIMYC